MQSNDDAIELRHVYVKEIEYDGRLRRETMSTAVIFNTRAIFESSTYSLVLYNRCLATTAAASLPAMDGNSREMMNKMD